MGNDLTTTLFLQSVAPSTRARSGLELLRPHRGCEWRGAVGPILHAAGTYRKTVFLFSPLFILQMTSFCQDRLGINIGKALKTRLCYRSWADRSLSTRRGGRCASCACSTWTTQLLSRPTAPSRITLMRHRTMSTRSATAATRRRLRPLVCASQPLSRAAATTFQICGVLTRRALARVGSTTPIAAAFLPRAPAQTW